MLDRYSRNFHFNQILVPVLLTRKVASAADKQAMQLKPTHQQRAKEGSRFIATPH